jgi:hypothetical protein
MRPLQKDFFKKIASQFTCFLFFLLYTKVRIGVGFLPNTLIPYSGIRSF